MKSRSSKRRALGARSAPVTARYAEAYTARKSLFGLLCRLCHSECAGDRVHRAEESDDEAVPDAPHAPSAQLVAHVSHRDAEYEAGAAAASLREGTDELDELVDRAPREMRGHAQVAKPAATPATPTTSKSYDSRSRLTGNLFSSASSAKRSVIGCCESEFSSGGVEQRSIPCSFASRDANASRFALEPVRMKHPTTTPLVLNMINRGVVKAPPHMTREAFGDERGRGRR